MKPFVETLRVTNPVRQSRASSREASLAWGRATVTAKHPDRELLGVGGDYLDHVARALQRRRRTGQSAQPAKRHLQESRRPGAEDETRVTFV